MEHRVKIIACADYMMWYRNCIGQVFDVHRELNDVYIVRANDGYLNIILKKEAVVVTESDSKKKYIKITKCLIPVLWYQNYIGMSRLEVTHETPLAYWVKRADNNNAWVYKEDAVEINEGQQ